MGVVRQFRRLDALTPSEAVKPPLKWAGGKRWQLPKLLPYWSAHSHRRLVEPFCGGLAVATGLVPHKALLNDVNPHVVNLYQWLKQGLSIDFEMENLEGHYYRARERFNELLSTGRALTAEAAGLFYYLNRTGYNGLCRFNSRGGFNVPFGSYKTINYKTKTDFAEYRQAFRGWMFTCMDFEQLELEPSDFVYADPPYDVQFTQYSKGGFGWDDQQRAAEWLARHKGPVILSNQATRRIEELYRELKFDLKFLDAPRRISCTGDRTPAREVLALRNLR
jgi:DNA adenine methylase